MPRPPRSRWMWFSAGATAAVVVATAVLLWQRPTGPAEHTTAEPPAEELAVPSSVDAVEWTWEAPDGVAVRRVDRAAAGAVAVLDDGVVAVHGRTGAELWRYRHPGAAVDAGVTPDGRTVVVAVPDSGDGARLLTLDAATGETVAAVDGAEFAAPEHPNIGRLTGRTRVSLRSSGEEAALVARDLRTDEVVWEFDGGPECALDDEDGVAVTVDLVLPVLLCGADGTAFTEDGDADALAAVVALDARSGEQVWRQEWTRPAQRPFPRIDVAADEESYQDGLSSDGTAAVVDDPRLDGTPRVFDLRTGNEAADGLPEAPGAQTWFTGVGTETFVAVRVTEEGTVEYERTDYSGTVTARAAAPVPSDEFVVENSVLLADAVVRLVPGPWVDGDGGPLMDRVEVAVVPWGADRAAHTVEVAAPEPLDGVEGLRLLPVPGAVVVTGAGEDTGALTGLR